MTVVGVNCSLMMMVHSSSLRSLIWRAVLALRRSSTVTFYYSWEASIQTYLWQRGQTYPGDKLKLTLLLPFSIDYFFRKCWHCRKYNNSTDPFLVSFPSDQAVPSLWKLLPRRSMVPPIWVESCCPNPPCSISVSSPRALMAEKWKNILAKGHYGFR